MEAQTAKKIRVLHFPIANSKGGITQYALRNWKMIDKSRFQFDFATMSKTIDFEKDLLDEGCEIHYISCYAEENLEKFKNEFKLILLNGNYDIVHLHTKQWKSFEVELIAKEMGIKSIIVHAHSSGINATEKEKEEEERYLHFKTRSMLSESIATEFWACSRAAAEWLYGEQIEPGRIRVIPNAIDTKRFAYQENVRNAMRRDLGVENKFVLGHVGRFDYVKNHLYLLEILAKVCKIHSNAVLLLVGTGDMEEAIKQRAVELGVEKNLLLVGKSDIPEVYLQVMDVFVFPSLFEGFPLSVVEAQCAGLKCFCSDAITDEVILTPNVQLLALENIDCWVAKITELCLGYERGSQSELIEQMGFDIYKQITNLENAYCRSVIC